MDFNYKDLTYIRASLQCFESDLCSTKPENCDEDEYSEVQDDIQYVSRLLALTENEIESWESKGPSLTLVQDLEEKI